LVYPSEYFDAISSIGVITHLIDDHAAMKEIYRVLRPEGYCVVGVYLRPSFVERAAAKCLEFFYPRPRIKDFAGWAVSKAIHAKDSTPQPKTENEYLQPVRRYYTAEQLRGVFDLAGLAVEELITRINMPSAPLPGQHFRIYIVRRKNR